MDEQKLDGQNHFIAMPSLPPACVDPQRPDAKPMEMNPDLNGLPPSYEEVTKKTIASFTHWDTLPPTTPAKPTHRMNDNITKDKKSESTQERNEVRSDDRWKLYKCFIMKYIYLLALFGYIQMTLCDVSKVNN